MLEQIKIIKKNIKKMQLQISTDNNIAIFVPLDTLDIEVDNIIRFNRDWIIKQINQKQAKLYAIGVRDNTKFLHLGKQYDIRIDKNNNYRDIKLDGEYCVIYLKKSDNEYEYLYKVLERWCYATAKDYFSQLVMKYLPIVGKDVKKINIRKMRTRWGSCNPYKSYINLNIELLRHKAELIEYVVLHEVIHLIHHKHDHAFYNCLLEHMPNWRTKHAELNRTY